LVDKERNGFGSDRRRVWEEDEKKRVRGKRREEKRERERTKDGSEEQFPRRKTQFFVSFSSKAFFP
jgi:hypothetical protein